MHEVENCNNDATTFLGKHLPIPVSISCNLTEQPIFLANSNPRALVESFVDALDGLLATQSKAQMKFKFSEIATSVKKKLNRIFSALNQRRYGKHSVLEFEDECIEEEEEEQDMSTKINKHTRIKLLICTTTWKDTATFFQSLASAVENMILIY